MRRATTLFFLILIFFVFLLYFVPLLDALQAAPPLTARLYPPTAPRMQLIPLQGVSQLAVGQRHVCVVTTAGALKCWGNNNNGQLGDNSSFNRGSPVGVFGLSNGVQMVTTGSNHTCALTVAGGVKCWGANGNGELGDGTGLFSKIPVDVVGLSSGVTQITAGFSHTCAIVTGGGVKCWGDNGAGELGDGTNTDRFTPVNVSSLFSGVTGLAGGGDHFCALLASGGVKCWGKNDKGQVGDNSFTTRRTPVDVSGLASGVTSITAGNTHSCGLLTTGALKCWGNNDVGQLGTNSTISSTIPVDVSGLTGATAITAGSNHTCAVSGAGGALCWGNNNFGSIGDGETVDRLAPVSVVGLSSGIKAVGAGGDFTCALTNTGRVRCWGTNGAGELGNGTIASRSTPGDVATLSNTMLVIAAGANHTCAINSGGAVTCWGNNSTGNLGDATRISRLLPVATSGLSSGGNNVITGGGYSCSLTTSGGVQCWGRNDFGQLGNGTTETRLTPVPVNGLGTGVRALAAGVNHVCALLDAGDVRCWGRNERGQLGNGITNPSQKTPVTVIGLGGSVRAIAAGQFHTCAALVNGGAQCWGYNPVGQLGNGTTTDSTTPVTVANLTETVTAITAGRSHNCALLTTGTVRCWGANSNGQLGDGTINDHLSPVDLVGMNATVTAMDAGRAHTCAITSSGGLKCWGNNINGELGDATNADRYTPVDVSGLGSGVTMVDAGDEHTCAIVNGVAKCWGGNGAGQLGDGNGWVTTAVEAVQQCLPLTLSHTGSGSDPVASPTNSVGCLAGSYVAGDEISLTAGPSQEWTVGGWTGTSNDAGTALTNSIAMPSNNHMVSVNYISTAPPTATVTDTPTPTATATTPVVRTALLFMPSVLRQEPPTPTITPTPTRPVVQWQRVGQAGLDVNTVAIHNDRLFLGERRETNRRPGGLYQRVLATCQATPPFALVDVVKNSSVLGLAFQGTQGVAATYDVNIFYTNNDGNSWNQSNTAVTNPRTVAIAGGSVFYAGTEAKGIYLSDNGGVTWRQLHSNPPAINRVILNTGTLWVGAETGVFKRTFESLTAVTNGLNSNTSRQVWDFAFSTANDIYIATFDGVYHGDGANAWQAFGLQGKNLFSLELSGGVLYAGVRQGGVWRRALNGGDWQPVTSVGWNTASTVRDLLYDSSTCNGLLAATEDGMWIYR